MRLGAVIVDNRKLPKGTLRKHTDFLSHQWGLKIINDVPISNSNDYNKLLTSIEFWESLPYDKVLIFQHDSGLLRRGIEEYFDFDFIGAPLYHIDFPAMNGGLSLRNVKPMIHCLKDQPFKYGNEDIYFCHQLQKLGYKLPTKEIAKTFSVETIFGLGSLGYHAIDKWHSEQTVQTILNQYK